MCIQKYRLIVLAMIASLICLSVEAHAQTRQKDDAEVLTLEQAIAIALRGNTQIRNAEIDVNKAGAGFAATRTRRLPNFSFEVIGSQQLTPIDFTFERGVFGTFPGIGP
ncbi:MAG TPA: hypothetical protein VID27_19515, partial [Blastocatellia bacterium]